MFELDHVAIQTSNVPASVEFYVQRFGAEVLYADATWALLRLGQGKLALVTPSQHPPHMALRVDEATLERAAAEFDKLVETHRDGTRGIYVDDQDGNVLELIHYPAGGTVYDRSEERSPEGTP